MPEHDDTYLTVATTAEGVYKEKGSKFIALVYPVGLKNKSGDTGSSKKKYYDARHHCYAFILGEKGQLHRANDDGEPTHSAGDPILGQIRSYQVTDVLVVVVRYFGGTKLGVSG
jgi:putative IMPACT (imprinted ancient) family translation regulator